MTTLVFHWRRFFLVVFCLGLFVTGAKAQAGSENILTGIKLSRGLNLGVDSSSHKTDWFGRDDEKGHFVMSFPAGQEWAAVFVTADSPNRTKEERRYRDYSGFQTLSVEMKGMSGGEKIEVGIKSKDQKDDGSEVKIPVTLTPEWKTYQFSLNGFKGADLNKLFVLAEFVYTCSKQQTVHLRNIKYLREAASSPEAGGTCPCEPAPAEALDIMVSDRLSGCFGLGVDSSENKRDWLSKDEGKFMIMNFPAEQDWSAIFVTVGPPNQRLQDGRKSMDLSGFKTLSVEMRGLSGGEKVEVGIKGKDQKDDGSEVKIPVTLTPEWKTYQFSLDSFKKATPKELFVVAEFVYTCSKQQTVHLRNIKYLREAATSPEAGADGPCKPTQAQVVNTQGEVLDIMVGARLSRGFGLGVDSSERERDWLSKKEGDEFMTMDFPAEQDWSAVFVTVGPPNQKLKTGRRFIDVSAFRFLSIDMKGAAGEEVLEIGIKTNTQEDDGSETKVSIKLGPRWETIQFPLERFKGTDLTRLYVVAEFVYVGSKSQTVLFRNIKYLRTATEGARIISR